MKRLSRIECLPVVDADGRKLGHLWDLRTEAGDSADGRAIASFLVGPVGWIRRIGLKVRANDKVKARDIVRLGGSKAIRVDTRRRKD